MKISTLLDYMDNGRMTLPQFQRGYVWSRDQVRALWDSLYRRHPIGSLLVWVTQPSADTVRGDAALPPGVINLLLDGQQRLSSVYGVVRGGPPPFFEGNARVLEGLYFHLETEIFQFHQPLKMRGDPLWIDVTRFMQHGTAGIGTVMAPWSQDPALAGRAATFLDRLLKLAGVLEIDLHVEEITGAHMTLDTVVDIFNRVNSGGTKLSKGDLALAKICADWPDGRGRMNGLLDQWRQAGFLFDLDWLLRCVNTVLTGEAKFEHLHNQPTGVVQAALDRTQRHIDDCLNLVSGRLGLDHDRVLFGRYAFPVLVRYLDQHPNALDAETRDRLLFWFVEAAMWGRFSGSTESVIDQDLAALEAAGGGLERLLDQLRLWHGSLRVQPAHFTGSSVGARFYPVLYWITRVGEARDWGSGIPLKSSLLGRMNYPEVHHIFPRAQMYKRNFPRVEVNAVANYCFLTKSTNIAISDRLPEDYFPEVEARHPGALASQWIPMDRQLWRVEHYQDFLEARKQLLA
ncbi:MAG: GmrSD restriction endonuclease domain-containing protein, partial [Clostridia bacterium]